MEKELKFNKEYRKDLDEILKYDEHFNGLNPSKESLENHREMIKKSLSSVRKDYDRQPIDWRDKMAFDRLVNKYKIEGYEINNLTPESKMSELGFSTRTYNCLSAAPWNVFRKDIPRNAITIGDLLMFSEEDILGLRNMGKPGLNEVKEKLSKIGYSLNSPSEEQKWA